jgi:hypothetical protein
MAPADDTFYKVESVLLTGLVAGFALRFLILALRRPRPELRIGQAVAAAWAVRVIAAAVISQTSTAAKLRGGDELTFMQNATGLAQLPLFDSHWPIAARSALYQLVLSLQIKFLHSPDLALRVTQTAIAVAGLMFLATAVYDVAGRRAAKIAAWLLAFEPASVFFSGVLHKEALMFLAEGLVVFGAAGLWMRGRLSSIVVMGLGCMVALTTRSYAALFMIAAAAAVTLHASVRAATKRSARAVTILAAAVLVGSAGAGTVLRFSTEKLSRLQASVNYSAEDNSNLSLERVDVSTPSAAIRSLPARVRDISLRPYPWEAANTSQRIALLGTAFLFVGWLFLFQAVWRNRGRILQRAAPFAYPLGFLLVAYALAAGNAGTGFRYRTHLVAIGICLVIVLRERAKDSAAAVSEPVRARSSPALAS